MIRNILVTGANGFIGKRTVEVLLENGYIVKALVNDVGFCRLEPHENLTVVRANICDYESLKAVVGETDAIIHLAANKYHPKKSFDVAIGGARNLVQLVDEGHVVSKRIINISSQSTKIKWRGVYGESKLKCDEILSKSVNVKLTTLKPSLVYGKGNNTIFNTIASYALKLPFIPVIGDGSWILYPIDVDDLAIIIVKTLSCEKAVGKVYDIGCESGISFNKLVDLIQVELKVSKKVVNIPFVVGLVAVWLVTKIIPNLPISLDNVLGSNQNTHCRPKKAISEFGVKPLSTSEGIKKYLREDNKLRIAIVGLGKMGILHATILATMEEVKIAAVVDVDKKLGKTAISMGFGTKFYEDLKTAIEKEKIEAVFICTPNFNHQEIIKVCLNYDVPFMVEKPVAANFEEWQGIEKGMTKKVRNRSMAGYFWVQKREITFIKSLLKRKVIGEVESYRIILKHGEVFGKKSGWMFCKRLSGGGVLMNPGPHAFSVINCLFGKGAIVSSQLKNIYENEVEDEARVELKHGRIRGELMASWSVKNEPVLKIEIEIRGQKGKIIFRDGKLTVNTKQYDYEDIPREGEVFNLNPRSGGDAYYLEDREFVENCFQQKPISTPLFFAREVEQMIFETYKNAK
jgi:NADH dehydrogenase